MFPAVKNFQTFKPKRSPSRKDVQKVAAFYFELYSKANYIAFSTVTFLCDAI